MKYFKKFYKKQLKKGLFLFDDDTLQQLANETESEFRQIRQEVLMCVLDELGFDDEDEDIMYIEFRSFIPSKTNKLYDKGSFILCINHKISPLNRLTIDIVISKNGAKIKAMEHENLEGFDNLIEIINQLSPAQTRIVLKMSIIANKFIELFYNKVLS